MCETFLADMTENNRFCLFVDIGGNRDLDALVALVPWLTKKGNLPIYPKLVVVKSQRLFEAMDEVDLNTEGWLGLKQHCAQVVIDR